MLIRERTWTYIRDDFSVEELESLHSCIIGKSLSPPGFIFNDAKMPMELRKKLEYAIKHYKYNSLKFQQERV
jgi:hypothetical protein